MLKRLLIGGIKTYQWFARGMGVCVCRFSPTCSQYALEALEQKGILKGLAMTAGRILRCHPFCKGGFDPVKIK